MACMGLGEIGPMVHEYGYENCGGPAVLEAKVMGKPQEWLEPCVMLPVTLLFPM